MKPYSETLTDKVDKREDFYRRDTLHFFLEWFKYVSYIK